MKARSTDDFGARLVHIRKARGLSQAALAQRVGVSRRMIAYYERESTQPPGPLLGDLSHALGVKVEELLGLKPMKAKADPRSARLMNRLKKVEQLSAADQRTVLKLIDALVTTRAKANGR